MNTLVPWSAYGLLLTTTKEISYFALFLLLFLNKTLALFKLKCSPGCGSLRSLGTKAPPICNIVIGEGALWWRWTTFIRQNPPGFCSSAYCTLVVIDGITPSRGRATVHLKTFIHSLYSINIHITI